MPLIRGGGGYARIAPKLRLSTRHDLLTAHALGSALGLTACGGGTDPAPQTSSSASSPTASTPASSPAAGGEAASPGVLAHGDDKGFCFFGPESITCFGKHGNSATLNATGPAELRRDLPATGWEELPEPTTLAPGQSATLGGFECEATAAGFTCVSTTSGAGLTVEGPEMSTIPPTR